MNQLPDTPGAYILCLRLAVPRRLVVGRLGAFTLPAGDYCYVGSARGPGGLRARLGRHLGATGSPHWHIDALRPVALVAGYLYLADPRLKSQPSDPPLECRWSQALAALPGASLPIPGFGASDCRAGCPAHLVRFTPPGPGAASWLQTIQAALEADASFKGITCVIPDIPFPIPHS